MKKYTAVLLIFSILMSLCVMPSLAEPHWAEEYAKSLVEKGIVSGYEDGSLKLDNTISRAEFVKIINKLLTIGYLSATIRALHKFTHI